MIHPTHANTYHASFIGPAYCNHCNCNHKLFSESKNGQSIVVQTLKQCGYSCSGCSLLVLCILPEVPTRRSVCSPARVRFRLNAAISCILPGVPTAIFVLKMFVPRIPGSRFRTRESQIRSQNLSGPSTDLRFPPDSRMKLPES